MKLNNLVEKELDVYRKECNFDEEELAVFNLKAKNKFIVQIALALNMSESKVSKVISRIYAKMVRIM